jgi:hypothetical protein
LRQIKDGGPIVSQKPSVKCAIRSLRRPAMFKIAALLYVIIAPTVMGVLVTVTLVVPFLYNGVGISVAALLGAIAAAPISYEVAKAIRGNVEI